MGVQVLGVHFGRGADIGSALQEVGLWGSANGSALQEVQISCGDALQGGAGIEGCKSGGSGWGCIELVGAGVGARWSCMAVGGQ